MIVLGIWDGHDAGAALVSEHAILAAVNEERLTRRKLDIAFPERALRACCAIAGIQPSDVTVAACSTSDVAKTLGRLIPATREQYYRVRRRVAPPGRLTSLTRRFKYRVTEWPPNPMTRAMSRAALTRSLRDAGVFTPDVRLYDHHECHAISAAAGSGFDTCAVLTVDGVGDGLCSTVSEWNRGRLTRIDATPACHSPGIFFEHVTNLLNMRELEDEGKVMALADYAAAIPDRDNPLMPLLGVSGLRFEMPVPGRALQPLLRRVLWHYPNEQFARMAQSALERACVQLARNAVARTGHRRIALAGGVVSNVKVNRLIRLLPEVDDVYVFPHMGDGGLAFGAAVLAVRDEGVPLPPAGDDLAWGPSYDEVAIRGALDRAAVRYGRCERIACKAAELVAAGAIVLWFDGGMEYGPRALGHRSVLARPDRIDLRDRLNLVLKRRVWYQPFCPSLLERDALAVLEEMKGRPNRHMTSSYMVRPACRAALAGVVHVDGSCRPQIVADDAAGAFPELLREVRLRTGIGAVLNTSFNIHGEPLVCTPDDALAVFLRCGADALAIGPFLVHRPGDTLTA